MSERRKKRDFRGHVNDDGSRWFPPQGAIAEGLDVFVIETHQRYRALLLQHGKVTRADLENLATTRPRRPSGRPTGSPTQDRNICRLENLLFENPELRPTTAALEICGGVRSQADYLVRCWRRQQKK